MKFLALLFFVGTQTVYGATIAIIDSGVDIKHTNLVNNIWQNPLEVPGNNRDEDKNGFQDDVFGWNFAEDNNEPIDYSYLGSYSDDVYKFFDIQNKIMRGTSSSEEENWIKSSLKNESFIKELTIYGNFAHGSHVGGISVRNNASKILTVKMIPTEVKLPGGNDDDDDSTGDSSVSDDNVSPFKNLPESIREKLLSLALKKFAEQSGTFYENIGSYVNFHKVEVANGSFGVGGNQVRVLVAAAYKLFMFKEPTEEQLVKFLKVYLDYVTQESLRLTESSKGTFFVFAAGNDGSDNDILGAAPANVNSDNSISVAATIDRVKLAGFSNYGAQKVHVAAPGVGIYSTVPGDQMGLMSGTSQAAPYVTNVVSTMIDRNVALKPLEIKKILIGTVDKKAFLTGKVLSGGIVNKERAIRAAELLKKHSLKYAIALARQSVRDVSVKKSYVSVKDHPLTKLAILPLPSPIVIK